MPHKSLKQRVLGLFAKNDVKIAQSDAKNPVKRSQEYKNAERVLINAESEYGRTIFGEIQPGHSREFFCLEKNIWIWYEDGRMIRYEVRSDGVYKKVDSGLYHKIDGAELLNFRNAVKVYTKLVKEKIYTKK